jgi:hypothetical protein
MSVRSRMSAQFVLISFVLVLAGFLAPTEAQAQSTDQSYWGINASFTPSWSLMKTLEEALFEDAEGTIEGKEFTIGFVRGSTLGGDWGVSFVRKPWKDGSGGIETNRQCFNQAQTLCADETTTTLTEGVYLNGVEFHWFGAFVKIKDRAQIGLHVAGGVGQMKGNIVETRDGFEPVFTPPNQITLVPFHEVEILPVEEELLKYFPLVKLDVQGAVVLTPALKAKLAFGLNFPGYAFRVGATYLFGAQ